MPVRHLLAAFAAYSVCQNTATAELPTASFNGLSRANGKQVARLGNEWLVVTPDPSGERAWLSIGRQMGRLRWAIGTSPVPVAR